MKPVRLAIITDWLDQSGGGFRVYLSYSHHNRLVALAGWAAFVLIPRLHPGSYQRRRPVDRLDWGIGRLTGWLA